jgi:hypothetical protein
MQPGCQEGHVLVFDLASQQLVAYDNKSCRMAEGSTKLGAKASIFGHATSTFKASVCAQRLRVHKLTDGGRLQVKSRLTTTRLV